MMNDRCPACGGYSSTGRTDNCINPYCPTTGWGEDGEDEEDK
jgi:hypothetical protein